MAVNTASSFSSDIENYISDEVLDLSRRQMVVYQFGDPITLPKGRGTTYTATRFKRIPLPYAPLAEGVPPFGGQNMTIEQINATVQQWGDKVTMTDVAEMTIKHPLFQQAVRLVAMQCQETFERNTFNQLLSGSQVNYVNSRGARGALVAPTPGVKNSGDVMSLYELNRINSTLYTLGVPRYMGDEQTNQKIDAKGGQPKAGSSPRTQPHYVAVMHPLVEADLRQDSTVVTAWSYSDINKLYNDEIGELAGIRFTRSNFVPSFTGVAGISGAAGASGSLPTGTYYITVTASDAQTQYENRIYQVSSSIAVTGPTGSIAVTLPVLPNYSFNVYVGTSASPVNLGQTIAGPTSGSLQGQATQLAGGQTINITSVGAGQVPPAAPATGTTVFPTFVFGRGAYGQVVLDEVKTFYLNDAEKVDPMNQTRTIAWKAYYGTIIQNQNFFMRVESVSGFNATFS